MFRFDDVDVERCRVSIINYLIYLIKIFNLQLKFKVSILLVSRQISQSRLVRHHGHGSAVLFPVRRFGEIDLLEFELVTSLTRRRDEKIKSIPFLTVPYRSFGVERLVLRFGDDFDRRRFGDDALHRHLDEFVERVELLANETLLFEVGRYDDPASFLP